ncbi:MAG: hypothetical protein ABIP63_08195 [Thermoanaerobaculia bacterium]
MNASTWRTHALTAAVVFTGTIANAQVVANNSLTVSWSGGGVKAGSVVTKEGSPRSRIVYTDTTNNLKNGYPYPTLVAMFTSDGGTRGDRTSDTSSVGGVQGPVVGISLTPRALTPGTYAAVELSSKSFRDFPFQPAFFLGNIPNGPVCQLGEATGTITITEIQAEQLELRFHVTKLNASVDGRCTANGQTFHAVMKADEPTLGGIPLDRPAADTTPVPPIPINEASRTQATYSVTMSSDRTANIGGVGGGKSYAISQRDAKALFSVARAKPTADVGAPPVIIGVKYEASAAAATRTGVSALGLTMRTGAEFVVGQTYTGGDTGGFDSGKQDTQFELQMNNLFCSGGVFSTYTVEDLTFDCESVVNALNNGTVAVAPHLRSLRVSFTTRCGNQAGGFKGTLTFNDPVPGNEDCANPIIGAPPVITTPGIPTTPTTPTTPTDPSTPTTPTTPTPPSTPTTPTTPNPTPSNAPGVVISGDLRSNGLMLANSQSASVNISTVTPSSVSGPVTLSVVSNPPGLDVSISPSHFDSGNGASVITISAGPTTQPQDYTVTIAATGTSGTSYTSFVVSIVCDPPVILGINQPRNATVNRGSSATLEVTANGSAPLNYQWYAGDSGNTSSPVAGARARTFTTPSLNAGATYWVRVSNACGSTDSNSATVTVR